MSEIPCRTGKHLTDPLKACGRCFEELESALSRCRRDAKKDALHEIASWAYSKAFQEGCGGEGEEGSPEERYQTGWIEGVLYVKEEAKKRAKAAEVEGGKDG